MLKHLLNTSRPTKRLISVSYDCGAICLSLYCAWALRLDSLLVQPNLADYICLSITLAASIGIFIRLGLYRAILRFMAHQAVLSVLIGVLASSITLAAASFFFHTSIPRSVPIIYVFTALFFVGMPRAIIRNLVQLIHKKDSIKVVIYGAGRGGNQLVSALQHGEDYLPIAFVDDDKKLHGASIRGLHVLPPEQIQILIKDHEIGKVFLALGNIARSERLRIVRYLERFDIQVQTVPPLADILSGQARIEELRNLRIEDLLGRDSVAPNQELMNCNIENKVVMVTGAGGSIGSELCRQILKRVPTTLILFELNEFNLYKIEAELQAALPQDNSITLIPLLGSVQKINRLEAVMRSFNVDTVYHAAAYKHVPLVEKNMIEGIRNNVFGTLNCGQAALNSGVDTFVLISTDKAVRPTNIMGASKRLAELVLQSLKQPASHKPTKFCAVRFGNVLGSSGSVVPKFHQQIQTGGPVTVTHPNITRYFMTLPEAAQLVIQAGALTQGQDTFVLDMGEPVKIAKLAEEMIQLSGLSIKNPQNPTGDIEIEFCGLRPGEKLYEELLISDNAVGTKHPRITQALEDLNFSNNDITNLLEEIDQACHNFNYQRLHQLIQNSACAYSTQDKIHDSIYNQKQLNEQPELTVIATQLETTAH